VQKGGVEKMLKGTPLPCCHASQNARFKDFSLGLITNHVFEIQSIKNEFSDFSTQHYFHAAATCRAGRPHRLPMDGRMAGS
jgi:hypothetical protein